MPVFDDHAFSSQPHILLFQSTLLLGFLLLCVPYRIRLFRLAPSHVKYSTVSTTALALLFAATVAVVVIFRGSIHLVGLSEQVAARTSLSDAIKSAPPLSGYVLAWLQNLFIPLAFALLWFRRRFFAAAAVLLLYILVYAVMANKLSLISIFALLAVAVFANKPRFVPWLLLLCSAGLSLLTLAVNTFTNKFIFYIFAYFNMRMFYAPGLLLTHYYEFFSLNPLTYFSHVKGISLLVHYPYNDTVAHLVADYQFGRVFNANASFWASDGIASLGLPGILAISVFVAFVFYVVDVLSQHASVALCATALAVVALSFTNVSVFTALLTGGLGLLAVSFRFLTTDVHAETTVPQLIPSLLPGKWSLSRKK